MPAQKVKISETVRINSLVLHRQKQGKAVFNLGAGEPVLDTPELIKRAAEQALRENKTLYPPVAGIPELRKLAAHWMNNKYRTHFKPDNVLVTNGGKLGLYLIFQSLLKQGDEVLLNSPYWVSYPGIVKLFGGKPKILRTTEAGGWKITPNCLKKACGKKTKILILNNANNPTGILYSKSELKGILKVAAEKKLTVISDEVYSGLIYGKNKFYSCASFGRLSKNSMVIQSCSKNFAMTGWRVGFVFAESQMVKILTGLLSQSTSGVTTISQWAAVAALKYPQKFTLPLKNELRKRRDVLVAELNKAFGLSLKRPESSLYLFVKMGDLGAKKISSMEFCKGLLEKTGVALIPGSACGQEGYIRFSFGSKPEVLKKAIKILANYCKKLN